MTLTSYSSLPSAPPRAQGTLPDLRLGYLHEPLDTLLDDPRVLAVVGFGDAPARHADPRYLRVALQCDVATPFEVWRSRGPVTIGSQGPLRWAADADYEFGVIELDEAAHGGLAAAAELAYTAMDAHFAAASALRFPLRIWNYLDAINLGAGDEERYRQFCSGRAAGMRQGFARGYPAATAIGVRDGRRTLQVYWLAARHSGEAIENPRQLNAWRYPRQYGPDAPSFARAMRAPTASTQVYISGTAAIVGHVSLHHDDFAAQMGETLANLDSLLGAAGVEETERFGARSVLKAYVRREQDLAVARALIAASAASATPLLLLRADICRSELLIEIDGVQGTSNGTAD
ncbi:MAG: pteridine-dependent deoxygenase [Rudaea sp.]